MLVVFQSYAQPTSKIYDKHYRLKVDSTFSISEKAYCKWATHEDEILFSLFNENHYPPVAKEAGLQNLLYIYSIHLNDTGIYDVQIHESSEYQKLGATSKKLFLAHFEQIISRHNSWLHHILKISGEESVIYYLPFKYELVDASEFISPDGMIMIKDPLNLIHLYNCD